MKDVEGRKKERERLKMLTYDEQMQTGGDGYGAAEENQLALVPLQDYEGDYVDYADGAALGNGGSFN